MHLPSNSLFQRGPIILGVDVGTTNIKCYAYDRNANVLGKASEKIHVLNTENGGVEIAPDDVWENFLKVVNNCLISSQVQASEVTCMGISTLRATFLTWDSATGDPFHNFITWKDQRADDISARWNASILFKLLRFVCFLCFVVTRKTRFQILSALQFTSAMVLTRLYVILQHFPEIRRRRKQVLFGTVDTWLVWKLTGGAVHATDPSNACVTGFYDPMQMSWVDGILRYFDIPENILPCVKHTSDSFGETLPNIFGSPIPIHCLVGDQQGSAFGAGCYEENAVNCTMGTGSFLTINTGPQPSPARHGVVPLIGWWVRSQITYLSECRMHDTGTFVSWLQNLGFFSHPAEARDVARSVPDSGGVYFLPICSSSKNPDVRLLGLQPHTTREQIVRSVLESLAFQVCLLFEDVCRLTGQQDIIRVIRICGGVAKNDFVAQLISDVTRRKVERLKHSETSSLGAAFLAGLHAGVWKTKEDLMTIQRDCDVFTPADGPLNMYIETFQNWKKHATS